jgi:hypothetical protein
MVSCPGQLWGNRVAKEALFKPSISPSTLCVPGGGHGTACPAYRQAEKHSATRGHSNCDPTRVLTFGGGWIP